MPLYFKRSHGNLSAVNERYGSEHYFDRNTEHCLSDNLTSGLI